MDHEDLKLAADFPAVSYDGWRKIVEEKELKGAPFDKKMVTKTPEGIGIRPLYVAENWPWEGDPSGFPGFFPYTRGTQAIVRAKNGWDKRQEFKEPEPKAANREIRHDLARGVTSAALRLDRAARGGLDPAKAPGANGADGVMAHDAAALAAALEGVDLARVAVQIEPGAAFLPAAMAFSGLLAKQEVDAAAARGNFGADPLGTLAELGRLPYAVETGLAQLGALAAWTAETWPGIRAAQVDTSAYHHAGASEAHDLGIALATGVAYLKAMEAAGMGIDDACRQIGFTLCTDQKQYVQIAKMRAARKLWGAVATSCGASDEAAAMQLRAKSAQRMFTRTDPWVNMLRATVSTFAAAVGGADIVTCLPFDDAIGLPDSMGRRIARNTQIILMEESNLFRVLDQAGGAWSMESLTDEMAENAWAFFREIEAKGGIVEVLRSGFLKDTIAATMAARDKEIAKRKTPITGVSEFPNITEKVVERPRPDLSAAAAADAARRAKGDAASAAHLAALAKAEDLVSAVCEAVGAGASFAAVVAALADGEVAVPAMPKRHLADSFERLRDAATAYGKTTGKLPQVFLANLGPVSKHTGRATFAKNFFEAGGIQAPGNGGFSDVEACVAAFKQSGARIAIICSADALYEEMVPTFAPALKAAGAETLYLAGVPGDKKDAYDAAGIDAYIFMGCEVLGMLTEQLVRLGVIEK
ncbi:methylmalonyl-CoA mutase family protein [Oleispirillum naphthae]|uniref:methylmalonyl-CoA mutase family protein n=1 Tax=Oleispirillum naphthae TaxID=2838853 RepID=UPI0030824D95